MHAVPRPAATILILRDTPNGLETWLMERSRSVGFMASAWVFPGGRVDPADADAPVVGGDFEQVPRPFWAAAVRELSEEAGIFLKDGENWDLRGIGLWSHWITPEMEPRRYDTWFFVARLPDGAEAKMDGMEAVDGRWFRPEEALELSYVGKLLLAPPTVRTLQELLSFRTVAEAMAAPKKLVPICPRFAIIGEDIYTLLPGDPDFPSDEPVGGPTRFQVRWRNETLKALRALLEGQAR